MPELPRNLPHIYLRGSGRPEPYITRRRARGRPLPPRDRRVHAETLGSAIAQALSVAESRRAERDPNLQAGTPGFYLEFEIPNGAEIAAELLENRRKQIELVALRPASEAESALATVFVPDSAVDHFPEKIEQYRTQTTAPRKPRDPHDEPKAGRPKNEDLIARIDNVRIGAFRSVYTDDVADLPATDQRIWWEVWVRRGFVDAFESVVSRLEMQIARHRLDFPDREVRLVYADMQTLGRLYLNSGSIAEVRCAKDTPAPFVSWSNVEQAAWASDLAERVVAPTNRDVAICCLDTGTTQAHPLLALALGASDLHKYDPAWPDGDLDGHGTNMAGTVLYGNLVHWLETDSPVYLTHCLESVKILPDQGENEPTLYGSITRGSIDRAELAEPDRRRAVCLAVTSDIGTYRGHPSSWSASIDQLAFGGETTKRLILISAGNIRDGVNQGEYPARNEIESIENPGQAWNALTVGAFTEKTILTDPDYTGWHPIAPAGDLGPTSRTSLLWERQWPIKPEILMEGGNWASDGDQCDCPDDLGILTTHRDPTTRHFDIFRDTSAATAMASHLVGRMMAVMPQRWPETIRALVVHSAEWTPAMQSQFDAATLAQQKRSLLRKYGYGVPSYERAVLSAANDLTLIAEDEIAPSGVST